MPIEMPKGLPFSVDTFSPSSKRKRHHFLTHAHKDHTSGISSHFSYPIYSTHLTKSLVLLHYPQLDDSLFVGIEVGESIVINNPNGEFQEEILTSVSLTFGSKIYVDKANNADYFQSLTIIAPEILSEDPTSRFRLFDGFPQLSERATIMFAEAQANFQHEPVIIRPSAMWYVCEEERLEMDSRRKLRFNEAIKDQFGVWHVCCSMHSSREELEWALKLLAPKRVVSTTPSCRAMELDYACSPMVELSTLTCVESELRPINVPSCKKRLLSLSPPSKRPPVTLFGQARLSLHDPNFPPEEKCISTRDNPLCVVNEIKQVIIHNTNEDFENRLQNELMAEGSALQCKKLVTTEIFEERLEKKLEAVQTVMQSEEMRWDTYHEYRYENKQADEITMQCENLTRKETNNCSYSIGYSKGYSDNFRKLYRSMNAPVPEPLPSLVELRNAIKRSRGNLFVLLCPMEDTTLLAFRPKLMLAW
ncbi:hypothetical protein GOBAR_DD31043 [Gossypium barbadense]|nr:hypothetical protein GOBAR_DD31043 [Gossypium barbadense]